MKNSEFCFTSVASRHSNSIIQNPLVQTVKTRVALNENHELHVFIHIHTITTQGRDSPCVLKPECALSAATRPACATHQHLSSPMLQFFQLFTPGRKPQIHHVDMDPKSVMHCVNRGCLMIFFCTYKMHSWNVTLNAADKQIKIWKTRNDRALQNLSSAFIFHSKTTDKFLPLRMVDNKVFSILFYSNIR